MTNLISNQDAFNALMSGKVVLCRQIEGEFAPLDRFPATVFGMQGYEFCIKLETIELAGITFTKPLTVDEYKAGQDVFVINTYLPSIYIIGFETAALIEAIKRGFVQRDAENAKLQLKAFSKALGFEINNDLSVVRLGEEPKKQRGKKSKAEKTSEVISAGTQPTIVITEQTNVTTSEDLSAPETSDTDIKPNVNAQFEILLDAIRICQSEKEVENVCSGLEKEGFTQEQLDEIEIAKQARLTELDFIEMDAADSVSEQVFSVLHDSFISEIKSCTSAEELQAVKRKIGANGHLEDPERDNLMKVIQETTFSDKKTSTPKEILKGLIDRANTTEELAKANDTILASKNNLSTEDLRDLKIHYEQRKEQLSQLDLIDPEPAYPEFTYTKDLIDSLIFEMDMAGNAEEVNAIFNRTRKWSEAQRKPLLEASHHRLRQLQNRPLIERIHAAQNIDVLRTLFAEIRLLENGTLKYDAMTAYKNREAQLPGAPLEISQ